jgi:hypothetical protein
LICYCQYHEIHQIIIQIIDDLVVFFKTYNLIQSNWNFIIFHMYIEIATKFQHFYLIDECLNWSHLSQMSNFVKTKILWILLTLSKLSILSNILIFIDMLPIPCNTSEKGEQNSKKIIWSFENFVKLFRYWLNFLVLTTWMVSMNSEWLELQIVQGRFPVSFEKSEIITDYWRHFDL